MQATRLSSSARGRAARSHRETGSDYSSSEEWGGSRPRARVPPRGEAAPNTDGGPFDDAHKENRMRRAHEERPRASKGLGDFDARAPEPQYDATDDIQDIDRRLNALQQFLEAAKAPR